MKKLTQLIEEFYDEQYSYFQTLSTILQNISSDEHETFYAMINKAKEKNKMLYIDESLLQDMWDSFELAVVKMK